MLCSKTCMQQIMTTVPVYENLEQGLALFVLTPFCGPAAYIVLGASY